MNDFEIVFSSSNINFVRVNEKLLDDYLVMVNDLEIQRLISEKEKTYTRAGELSWIKEKLSNDDYVFSMIEKNTNKFIGNIELMDVSLESAEIGICITKGMQNKGYGSESLGKIVEYAFDYLKLKSLRAIVFSNNYRSMRMIEKYGFRKYDVVYNVKTVNNEAVDDIYFILESGDRK